MITGSFALWAWLRLCQAARLVLAGIASPVLVAYRPRPIECAAGGRACAVHDGVHMVRSPLWLDLVEGLRPERRNVIGAGICLAGATTGIAGPRPHP